MQINLSILQQVTDAAIDATVKANKPEWLTSILKAQEVLISNPYVDFVDGNTILLSQTSNQIYTVNQRCNNEYGEPCAGFRFHRHCYHVALNRLVKNYLALTQVAPTVKAAPPVAAQPQRGLPAHATAVLRKPEGRDRYVRDGWDL